MRRFRPAAIAFCAGQFSRRAIATARRKKRARRPGRCRNHILSLEPLEQRYLLTASLQIADLSTNELSAAPSTPFVFQVTRSGSPEELSSAATVGYFTEAITGKTNQANSADNDFTSLVGTLSFAPGATLQQITVAVVADKVAEGHETFSVKLAAPTNALLMDADALGTILDDDAIFVLGRDAGPIPAEGKQVKVFDAVSGIQKGQFDAYPNLTGGVRVASGDVNGDGTPDIITAAGFGGGPHIIVFDGTKPLDGSGSSILTAFYAYAPAFTGGVFVAAGDVDGDGKDNIITGAGAGGGPHVRVFDDFAGSPPGILYEFFAFDGSFTGGVNVAAGDVQGDGRQEVIVGSGAGMASTVKVYEAGVELTNRTFSPYGSFASGVYVGAGDIDGDGKADYITGAGPGGTPHVRALRSTDLHPLANFYAYDPTFAGGVRVAGGDVNGDGVSEILTVVGPGGGPHFRAINPQTYTSLYEMYGFEQNFAGGVYVAGDTAEAVRAPIRLIDNTTPGFSFSNPQLWTYDANAGFNRDMYFAAASPNPDVPTVIVNWAFTGLPSGRYRVSMTWSPQADRTSAAPFTVRAAEGTLLANGTINQQLAPGPLVDAGIGWKDLASVIQVTTGTVTVEMTNSAAGYLAADAVRLQRVADINAAPVLDFIGSRSVNEAQTLSFQATASDADAVLFGMTMSPSVPGVAFNQATGNFSWTPGESNGGQSYSVTITAYDAGSPTLSDSETFTIDVIETDFTNSPPVLNPIGNQTVAERSTLIFRASATDPDAGDALSYTIDWTNAPFNATFDSSTGIFMWAPGEEAGPGTYTATVRAIDNAAPTSLEDSETFTITVNEQNLRPLAYGANWWPNWPRAVPIGFYDDSDPPQTVSFIASGSDNDLPAQGLTFSLAGGPQGASIDSQTGEFTWEVTPAQAVSTRDIIVTVTDSLSPAKSDQVVVPINISHSGRDPITYAPVANVDMFSVVHGRTLRSADSGQAVLDNDSWVQGVLPTIQITSGPSNGTGFIDANGYLTYTPNANFVGLDTLTYKITDYYAGGSSASHSAKIEIHVTNDEPVATNNWYSLAMGQSLTVSAFDGLLMDNTTDADGDATRVASVPVAPAHGTLSWNANGSFSYQPFPGFTGTDAFVFKIDDFFAQYFEDIESFWSDDFEQYGIATLFVNDYANSSGPVPVDDYFSLEFDAPDITFELPVLLNDFHSEGAPIRIVGVTSTTEGATVWINSTQTALLYRMPAFTPTTLSIGGVITLGEEIPISTGSPEETGLEGGFANFEDSFSYTIADNLGATSTAMVQVNMQKEPEWKAKLKPTFDDAAEVGIDGRPGYSLQILQVFGENARGLKAAPETQTWQKNTQTALNMYVDANGAVKQDSAQNRVLQDTRRVPDASRTPLEVTDRLGLAKNTNATTTILILESVAKKLGFNAPGQKLPVPVKQPWAPNEAELRVIEQMRGPFLEMKTAYFYLDKKLLTDLHTQGKITDAQLDAIKNTVNNNGLIFNDLPDVYESYILGTLKTWEFK